MPQVKVGYNSGAYSSASDSLRLWECLYIFPVIACVCGNVYTSESMNYDVQGLCVTVINT